MVIKSLIAILLGAALICSAQTKTKSAQTSASKIQAGFVLTPSLVMSDLACAKDYIKALNVGGIEGRKMLSDLVTYGCVRQFERGIWEVSSSDRQEIASPRGPVTIWKVVLGQWADEPNDVVWGSKDKSMEAMLDSCKFDQCVMTGWILDKDFARLGEGEVVAMLQKAKRARDSK